MLERTRNRDTLLGTGKDVLRLAKKLEARNWRINHYGIPNERDNAIFAICFEKETKTVFFWDSTYSNVHLNIDREMFQKIYRTDFRTSDRPFWKEYIFGKNSEVFFKYLKYNNVLARYK